MNEMNEMTDLLDLVPTEDVEGSDGVVGEGEFVDQGDAYPAVILGPAAQGRPVLVALNARPL